MKKILLALCLSTLLLLTSRAAALAGKQDFTLVNKTGLEISELYVSASDTDNWEEDILGQDSLEDGKSVNVHFDAKTQAAKYDLKIVDGDGDEVIWKGINLLKVSKITLHYANKKPTADLE